MDATQPTDSEGLNAAYDDPQGVAVHGGTLYISGTHTARDVFDDIKIPFHQVHRSERYAQAVARMGPGIHTVVGHSLGGAVAARLVEDYPHLKARTYGAPLLHTRFAHHPRIQSFRKYGDPVSFFDRSATMVAPTGNPHAYGGYSR